MEEFNLGNGCSFIATSDDTIQKIHDAEKDLLEKASANEDPKMEKYYSRVQRDPEYRMKKVVVYVLNSK